MMHVLRALTYIPGALCMSTALPCVPSLGLLPEKRPADKLLSASPIPMSDCLQTYASGRYPGLAATEGYQGWPHLAGSTTTLRYGGN